MKSKQKKQSAQEHWGEFAAKEELLREKKFPFVGIQTSIALTTINKYLHSFEIKKILDAGAGTGRYSIPLAKAGYPITHLDISEDMLSLAKQKAEQEGIETIDFKSGSVVDLSEFKDEAFDMTLSFDAPVSYSYPNHETAIKELCRVTQKLLLLMVSSRNGVIPFQIDFDLSRDYLPPNYSKSLDPFYATQTLIEHGVEKWPDEIQTYLEETGASIPYDYAFNIDEITQLVSQEGFEVIEMGGPCALARSIRAENLEKIINDHNLFERFIQLSMDYDFNQYNIGLGAVNLLLIAQRKDAS